MRLLVIDDSALIRSVTRLAFPSASHELQEADNGRGALEILDATLQPFDAILLDLRMPGMNGVEFIHELRRRPVHQSTPVVVATSEAEDSVIGREVRGLGIAAVVRKPWKPQELAEIVRQACQRRA